MYRLHAFKAYEVVLHLRLKSPQHAFGELPFCSRLRALADRKRQPHAQDDKQAFEKPMARRFPEGRKVSAYFHGRNPTLNQLLGTYRFGMIRIEIAIEICC